MADDITFWHYTDAEGRDVIVSDYNDIPKPLQETAKIFDERPGVTTLTPGVDRLNIPNMLGPVHVPSALLGFAVALALATTFMLRRSRIAMRLILGALTVALVASLYFGWVMRTAGLTDGVFGSPATAVDEAKKAVDDANQSAHARERALDKIEH